MLLIVVIMATTATAHDDEGQLALEGMMAVPTRAASCSTYPVSSTAL
jgi:hypothetical protein